VLFKTQDKIINMKTIQIIIIALLLSKYCYTQITQPVNYAIINGTIPASPSDTIIVTYYPTKLGNTQIGGIVTNIVTSDGYFRVQIPAMGHPFYCSILSAKWGSLLFTDQLIEPGDSLMIKAGINTYKNARNNNSPLLNITGHNAAKNQVTHLFEYARWYNKITGLITSVVDHYTSLSEALAIVEKNTLRYRQYWDSLLTSNNYGISQKAKEILYVDFEARKIKSLLTIYGALYEKFTRKKSSAIELQKLKADYRAIIDPMVKQLINSFDFITASPTFLDMAVRKTMIDSKNLKGVTRSISGIKYLDAIQQWPTACREEVTITLMAFLYNYTINVENTTEMIYTVKPMINKTYLKTIIQEFENLYSKGAAVLPFELTGINGEKIDSRNYSNKTIVLDFWFTGCKACIQMASVLKIAKKRLGDDEDIVFISVSIDKDRETWLKSVSEEKYTHADFINAYTGGDGIEHPLIKRYSITAYPRLLIIGKNNKLSTANPHFPESIEEVDILVQNILDAKN